MRWGRVLAGVLLGSGGLYGLVLGGLYAAQGKLLYQAGPLREVALASGQAVVVLPGAGEALWVAPPTPEAPVLLHFHGNGEQLADLGWLAAAAQRSGLGLLAPEFPGYGLRQRQPLLPDEPSLYAAGRAGVDFLRAHGVDASRTVLVGHSLGTGVAAQLATEGAGARLVLISPYTSITAMAERTAPFAPVRWLLRDRFDTLSKAPGLTLPVLVVHGTLDPLIPVEMGRALSRAFPHATYLEVKAGHHGDLFVVEPASEAAVLSFAATAPR